MYRKIALLFSTIVFAGCSAKPVFLYNQAEVPEHETVILTSRCDQSCINKIESTYKVDTSFGHTKNIGAAKLQSVNGIFGPNSRYGSDCPVPPSINIYNNFFAIDGGYTVHALSGEIEIDLYVNTCRARTPYIRTIEFISEKGHSYFVGNLTDVDDGPSRYKWTHLIVDLNTLTIIYPGDELNWFKY